MQERQKNRKDGGGTISVFERNDDIRTGQTRDAECVNCLSSKMLSEGYCKI